MRAPTITMVSNVEKMRRERMRFKPNTDPKNEWKMGKLILPVQEVPFPEELRRRINPCGFSK